MIFGFVTRIGMHGAKVGLWTPILVIKLKIILFVDISEVGRYYALFGTVVTRSARYPIQPQRDISDCAIIVRTVIVGRPIALVRRVIKRDNRF